MLVYLLIIALALSECAQGQCPQKCRWKITNLKKRIEALEAGASSSGVGGAGHVYTRWGRTTCPEKSAILYEGFAAGSFYSHAGGGSNYLCMPYDPQVANVQDGVLNCGALVYGAEYEVCSSEVFDTNNINVDKPHDQDVPCAVCQATSRQSHMMLPAKTQCPDGWVKEYQGYITSSHHTQPRTEWVCMDSDPEAREHGHTNKNGALFYLAEVRCGVLPCPNYKDGDEIACVVCTR